MILSHYLICNLLSQLACGADRQDADAAIPLPSGYFQGGFDGGDQERERLAGARLGLNNNWTTALQNKRLGKFRELAHMQQIG
jgi:hypothetical protein